MKNNRQFGRAAEEKAAEYLEQKGLSLLERNYVTPYGEIDLVALDGDRIVFVEVKCRTTQRYGLPREAVDARKQQRYYNAAMYYLQQQGERPLRFDVVEVSGRELQILHLENAF
jgi:putative endonuclease